MQISKRLRWGFLLASAGLTCRAADIERLEPAPASLAAAGSVAHDARDRLDETLGGFGSGLAYDLKLERYLAVADRGPGDGLVDYRPRYQILRIEQAAGSPGHLTIADEETVLFKDAAGQPFTGLVPDNHDAKEDKPCLRDGRTCLDPEGIAAAPDGTLYVSDEYGPFIYQFKRDGSYLRQLRPPLEYLPRDAGGQLDFSDNDQLKTGRVVNHGFEGVAVSPDGKTLTALLQSGLIQNGGKKSGSTRLLVFDLASGRPTAEYRYVFDAARAISARIDLPGDLRLRTKNISATEITAIDDHRFLVLERDNRGLDGSAQPSPAAYKAIWIVDIAGATNVLNLSAAERDEVMSGQRATISVRKTLMLDLVASPWRLLALDWPDLPEKWEGLALRPAADAQRDHYSLLVASDNDFLTPKLHLQGKDVPFPKVLRALDSCFLLFDVHIP